MGVRPQYPSVNIPRIAALRGRYLSAILLNAPSLEETRVGGFLFDVRSVTLLSRILVVRFFRGSILFGISVCLRTLGTLIAGRNWGHMTGHFRTSRLCV